MTQNDHAGVVQIAESLPEWFDETARSHSIPIDIQHQRGFVAVQDGMVVGFVTLYVAEGRLQIGWLGVGKAFRGKGIGKALLYRVEERALELGLAEVATYTLGDSVDYPPYEQTRLFYFRNGFEVYQRNQTDNPGCPEEIRIRKRVVPPSAPANKDATHPLLEPD
ncbi:MAG: GNAT family N-acetyltransferase [Coprothermobacterota bacterium]|nr:GNAT family N-acetyltransferase [Coprothermobacterota bacterium]